MIKYNNIRSYVQKTKRFGVFIPFVNLLLVYGRRIFSYSILSKMAEKRNKKVKQEIENIVGDISKIKDTLAECKTEQSSIIWFCWLQGEEQMPLIPQLCLKSIRKYANGNEVIVLSLKNLSDYIHIPERIMELYHKGHITAAHLSDIIRLRLLSEYGGFWIDSTMLLTSPIEKSIIESDLYSMKSKPEGFYISKCRWAGFCFYMKKGTLMPRLANKILTSYWEKEDWLIDYFMIDYIFDLIADKVPEVNYQINHIPFNNPELHSLCNLLTSTYDESKLQNLTKQTSFFKLSWKAFSSEQLRSNSDNFYNTLNKRLDLI